jgi:AcrR family transcriptional regulator
MQPESNRKRLIAAMLDAVEQRGIAAVSVLDVVGRARVSKRTFYESFATKEECFLAAYRSASNEVLRAIEEAADRERDWEGRIDACVRTYLELLEGRRALTRAFLLEIHAAGPAALRARRDVHIRFADMLRAMVQKARRDVPEVKPLSPKLAAALVGGVNELVLIALDPEGEQLGALAGAATDLVRAVVVR